MGYAPHVSDTSDRDRLTRGLSRLVACRQQLGAHREQIRAHASERLDGHAHAIGVASDALQTPEHRNVLVYRYLRAQLTEAARLRAIEGRGQPKSPTDDDADAQ